MRDDLKKKLNFRIYQSREKLRLSYLMLKKGLYNDSMVFSYLSIFYSTRILLIGDADDSDDYNKIHDMIDEFYLPYGWISLDIIKILKETVAYRGKFESDSGSRAGVEEAENFYNKAEQVLNEIMKSIRTLTAT